MPRPTIDVAAAAGGWPGPWQNVAELASVLPSDRWTLIGGLMTQLHVAHHGLRVVRPTNDVDIVLHIETSRGVPRATADALEQLGYRLLESVDPRQNTAHRFVRDASIVDLVAGEPRREARNAAGGARRERTRDSATAGARDTVDVLRADHSGPAIRERLRGREMVAVEGGTQALRRTVNARLEIEPGRLVTISVPRPFGAVVLKAAAYLTDSRDPQRHLHDAAALLACIEDPFEERDGIVGSDRKRLGKLGEALHDSRHQAWLQLPSGARTRASTALDILLS